MHKSTPEGWKKRDKDWKEAVIQSAKRLKHKLRITSNDPEKIVLDVLHRTHQRFK